MAEISEDEVKLLENLEAEGLLSRGVAKRIRKMLVLSNAVGLVRFRLGCAVALAVVACGLFSVAFEFKGGLSALSGSLSVVALALTIGFVIAAGAASD